MAGGFFVGTVIGLRLEVACLAADKTLAVRAMTSASAVAIMIGLALVVATTVAGHAEYIPVVGLAFGVFLQQALCAALTSERKYTKIAAIRFFPNALFGVWFVCLTGLSKGEYTGTSIFNVYSCIFLASNFALAAIYLYAARKMIPAAFMKFSALQIRYAKYGVPTVTLNSFVIYASAILIPMVFDHRDAGIFALAYRVGYFPASLLSQSLGAVFRRDLVDYFDGEEKAGVNPSKQFFTMLTLISLALVAACYAGLSLIIHLKMGKEWEPSMSVYAIFVPYFIAMTIYSSMATQIFVVVNRLKIDLVNQTLNALLILLSLGAAHFFGVEFIHTLLLISVGGTIVASVGSYQALKIGAGAADYPVRQPGLGTP
ncbi:hypothetical protein [Paraburkholderia sp. HD33-4]|uniref:hypothetical protein n=1 Tax=Paraburkholderia sp. HD33-4 TaxID=2883242 RepID=UPI001F20085E|nr:hypothetical protein [Paraburkholderia sp. HD33-4]